MRDPMKFVCTCEERFDSYEERKEHQTHCRDWAKQKESMILFLNDPIKWVKTIREPLEDSV